MTLAETAAPRRKCAMTTRGEMLCAARRRFLEESYENVGLRDIAGDVGVDVALVSRYFGSKEDLFKEVLRGGDSRKLEVEAGAENLPAYLASLFEANGDEGNREHTDSLLIMLRSASSPPAARIVHEAIREDMLGPIAAVLNGDNAEARAGLSLAILMGATMLRAIMGVQPSCDGDRRFIDRRLPGVFKAALAETHSDASGPCPSWATVGARTRLCDGQEPEGSASSPGRTARPAGTWPTGCSESS